MPAKNDYITLTTPGSKKIGVCARRVGTRDRHVVIATCTNDETAEKIVNALNLLQGQINELEVPAQKTLSEVRALLTAERERTTSNAARIRQLESELREKSNEIGDLKVDRDRAIRERDAARKTARENT